jgi:hypothetical protein
MVKVLPLVITALFLLQIVLQFSAGQVDWSGVLLGYLGSLLINLGILVVVFVVLEQLARLRGRPHAAFDPAKLPAVPDEADSRKPSTAGLVFEIYALAAVLVMVNFYSQWFGPLLTVVGPHRFQVIPLSALGIHIPVPLFDVWLCALIVLKTEVLREGNWTRRTRWVQIGLTGLGLVVLAVTLLSGDFGGQPNAALAQASWGLMTFLICLALLTAWKIGVAVRRLSRSARQSIA